MAQRKCSTITGSTAGDRNRASSADQAFASVSLPDGALLHLVAALKKQWSRYRKELKRCQKDFSFAAVHDSRVATRRLLSIVGLLNPFLAPARARKLRRLLKCHLDSLNQLRDTQVQLVTARKLKHTYPVAGGFYRYLRKREKHLARRTRRDVKQIRIWRLNELVMGCRGDLKKWRKPELPSAANALLLRMVHAAFARTQRLGDQVDPDDTKTIHRTRVAFKKFRYMVENLGSRLPHVDKPLLVAMDDFQTLMGDIQDAQVFLKSFERFARKRKVQPQSARAFCNHLRRHSKALIQVFLNTADHLSDFWPSAISAGRKAPRGVLRARRPRLARKLSAAEPRFGPGKTSL